MIGLYKQLFTKRGAESFIGAVPFKYGSQNGFAAGRRVLAITYTTATPNSIVFGILPDSKLFLYHQIRRTKIHQVTRNLGARP
jgi:hypothetical protein